MSHPPDVVMPLDDKEFNTQRANGSKNLGSWGEFYVAAELALTGATISFPATVGPKYDLVADFDGLIVRFQVKTTKKAKGKVKIPTGSYKDYARSHNAFGKLTRKYVVGDFDVMASVDEDTRHVLYAPIWYLDFSQPTMYPSEEQITQFSSLKWVLDNLQKA